MKVVDVKQEFFKDAAELSMYAFQYELTKEELDERIKTLGIQTVLGIFDNEQLAAKLYILPFEIFQQEKILKMGGIAGVATYPEYRRNGFVKELLIESLKRMKEAGQIISMLSPFYIDFYRKFGWEVFADHQLITINKEDLVYHRDKGEGSIKRFKKKEYHEDLHTVYEKYAKSRTGMLIRKRDWWQNEVLTNQTAAIFYSEAGVPEGYLLYRIENRKMIVHEFIALYSVARKELWKFICQHDSMLDKVEIKLAMDEPLTYILKNPRVKKEIVPYFMARIVDVEAYLKEYEFRTADFEQIKLKVEDEYAPWNSGIYTITPSGIQKHDILVSDDDCLQLTINTLTALLLGYMKTKQLWEIEAIKGDCTLMRRLEAILPEQQTYFPDFF